MTLGKSLSPSGSQSLQLYTEVQTEGKSKEARQAEGKPSCGKYLGLVWFDNIQIFVFTECKLYLEVHLGEKEGE